MIKNYHKNKNNENLVSTFLVKLLRFGTLFYKKNFLANIKKISRKYENNFLTNMKKLLSEI